ncbi:hypothetical protein HYH03_002640 [Edaphochlamys debaryana]|uniref:Calpain catalytic domain-containing protein n=1 Tax=Edaphochlamys debaryana TaxID=47281 RepID=A0A836C4C1_9CHLO|nr:hypothetical protein HYH03_002640 [Edaphochlamys debaryana]|eukprot:KAG2499705.1 hypothetical protein HYH03_002640 [Edaphochlamys debaryana]
MPDPAATPPPPAKGSTLLWLFKCIFWPVVLLVQAIRIYFLGCLFTYGKRMARGVLCGLCVCCSCTYKDKAFPPTARSIGAWEGKSPEQIDAEVKWRRIGDIVAASSKTGAKLFAGKIEPADIAQGGLGDCWLMSALACLANREGAVQQVFLTKEYTHYGKYRIRLYDAPKDKWVTVVIDDWIPCNQQGQSIFAKPNGDEAWVLLLEKAVAKFKGSYANLDGGHTMWALECLTGDYVFKFKADAKTGRWRRYEMVHQAKQGGGGYDVMVRPTDDDLGSEEMFSTLLWYNRKRAFLAASNAGGGNDTQNVNGIVQGHAYAVCNAKLVDRFQLVQLRNPWGTFEWAGAWSDNSPLWEQHPKVKRALDFMPADDGTFWMEWKDFCAHYNCLEFCSWSTGFDDIALDVHEEHLICGPTWGCVEGCFKYWLCCLGIRALFFSRQSRNFERPEKAGCCAC